MSEDLDRPAQGTPVGSEGPGSEPPLGQPATAVEPKRSKALPIAIAVAVVAAAAGVGAYFMLKGGGKAETPEAAVQGFYAALGEGDCAKASVFADPGWASEAEICKEIKNWQKTEGTLGKIASTDVQGSAAYLVASRTVGGVPDQRIMTVKKASDGSWTYSGNSACYGEESPEDLGNEHLDDGQTFTSYSSEPPTSGPHSGTAAEMGTIFKEPQPNEQIVHSMEHGAVVFWTRLDGKLGEMAEKAVLDVYGQGYSNLIINPTPDLEVPLAMTAWGTLQKCVGVDAREVQAFVDAHYAQGMEGFMACFDEKSSALPGCAKAI